MVRRLSLKLDMSRVGLSAPASRCDPRQLSSLALSFLILKMEMIIIIHSAFH